MAWRLLFLQLPRLDNAVRAAHENVRLAAAYLRFTLERSPEGRHWRTGLLPVSAETLDDAHLAQAVARFRPDVLACSLYLWNIERTLDLVRRLRRQRPALRVVAGGPEVARDHPFLFWRRDCEALVEGDGEGVFPRVLQALRIRRAASFRNVAWLTPHGYRWGHQTPPLPSLQECLPPPSYAACRPDAAGVAYLETTRGCPLRCTYCRYPHQYPAVSGVPPADTLRRVRALRAAGAREIRFIDPTLNAHPAFAELLAGLARLNKTKRLRFFAELRADTLTAEQARLLATANVREVEVGVQSRDPRVLRLIRRPLRGATVERGIRRLLARGLRVTVDLMTGLPGQTAAEMRRSAVWAAGLRRADVQCLHTLLLPGTELRARRREWGVLADAQPPYAVRATSVLPEPAMRRALAALRRRLGHPTDCPTRRFVGHALPDLFEERIRLTVESVGEPGPVPGTQARRALILQGPDLFSRRKRLARIMRAAVRHEPHIVWQFVLAPEAEEPLDLLDTLVAELKRMPPHLNDRWIALETDGRLAARRLFVWLRPPRRFGRAWSAAAEALLREHCY